jgi:hypothetical protein
MARRAGRDSCGGDNPVLPPCVDHAALAVNVEIMRAVVRLRAMPASHAAVLPAEKRSRSVAEQPNAPSAVLLRAGMTGPPPKGGCHPDAVEQRGIEF